jgi:prepilin-type N-terminal cleavage/methylation domain-containing protein
MRRFRGDHGYTLIELLVAMSMSLIVFGVTLSILIIYNHGAKASTVRNDAQDRARLTMDLITRQLRNISSPISSPKLIERASSYDLVFQTVGTPSGSNTGGAERVRYCIPNDSSAGDPTKEVLINQTQTWSTATAPAIPWGTACPDTSLTSAVVVPSATNRYQGRTDRPAFSYNDASTASDLTKITTVQIDLFVNPTPSVPAAEAELRSAVFLRNQVQAPVANITSTPTGNGGVILNAGSSYSPDGTDLSYAWSCTGTCPSSSTLTSSANGLIYWKPGAGTYTVNLTVTDPTGLTGTANSSVTVT